MLESSRGGREGQMLGACVCRLGINWLSDASAPLQDRSIEHIHTKHSQMNRDMENKSVGNVGSRMNHTTHGHYAERTYERLSVSTGGSCLGPAPGLILLNIFFGDL